MAVAALAFAAPLAGGAQLEPAGDGARGFQITADHAGFVRAPEFTTPRAVRWMVRFPQSLSYPIVANGSVFVVDAGTPSTLYALDARSGTVRWHRDSPKGFGNWIGAAYDRGRVFVVPTSGAMPGGSGAMFAFDARDGHELWRTALPGQYAFSSAPTAASGLVFTGGAGVGGTVYAVDEKTGSVVWTGSVMNGDSSAPAVTQDGVFVSYVCPQTYRFNPLSGKMAWNYSGPCEGGGGESAAVYRGLVYVRDVFSYPTDGITLDARSGALVGGFNSRYAPAFRDGTAFFTEPASLSAVDTATATTRWSAAAPTGQTFSCAPIVVNDVIYAATSAGELIGFRVRGGRVVFRMTLPQPVACGEYFATPLAGLAAGGGLLVVPAGNVLVAFH